MNTNTKCYCILSGALIMGPQVELATGVKIIVGPEAGKYNRACSVHNQIMVKSDTTYAYVKNS